MCKYIKFKSNQHLSNGGKVFAMGELVLKK